MGSFFMRTANTLVRPGRCPGSSESSLGVQAILSVLCGDLFGIGNPYHNQFYGRLLTRYCKPGAVARSDVSAST